MRLRRQRGGGRKGRRHAAPRSRPVFAAKPVPAAGRPVRQPGPGPGSDMCAPRCGYHPPIGAYLRLSLLLDPFTFRELWPERFSAPNIC